MLWQVFCWYSEGRHVTQQCESGWVQFYTSCVSLLCAIRIHLLYNSRHFLFIIFMYLCIVYIYILYESSMSINCANSSCIGLPVFLSEKCFIRAMKVAMNLGNEFRCWRRLRCLEHVKVFWTGALWWQYLSYYWS